MNNWVPTDRSEMRAFIGVMMAMGLLKKPTIESYWNKGDSFLLHSPSFSQVFSRNRFQNILRFLHCNDNTQAAPRGSPEYDPGYKIRPVFDILNNTFDRKYNLGRDLMVDESMVGFKGITNLVQYMPGKKRIAGEPSYSCWQSRILVTQVRLSCMLVRIMSSL